MKLHRKLWEWLFAMHALEDAGLLRPGARGLGFGVGTEPLTAYFASRGCDVVATDLDPESQEAGHWVESSQHAASLRALNKDGLCSPEDFAERVRFMPLDMRRIPDDLTGFDFTWSSCAFEHLGSITRGKEFILDQMKCLRPGGVAVHTTEFNLSSNLRTVDWAETVLCRRTDIEWLVKMLRREGHWISVDFDPGSLPADRHIDVPPFSDVHLKLQVERFNVTSLGLIIVKRAGAAAERAPHPMREPLLPDARRRIGSLLRQAEAQVRGRYRHARRAAGRWVKPLLRR